MDPDRSPTQLLRAALADLLPDAPLVVDDGRGSLFELAPALGDRAVTRRVELILTLLQAVDGAVLVCDDSPQGGASNSMDPSPQGDSLQGDSLPGDWPAHGAGHWLLPQTPLDLGDLLDWLAVGSWQLVGYRGELAPVFDLVDLFEAPQAGLDTLAQAGVAWAVDVFVDDAPWQLFVAAG